MASAVTSVPDHARGRGGAGAPGGATVSGSGGGASRRYSAGGRASPVT